MQSIVKMNKLNFVKDASLAIPALERIQKTNLEKLQKRYDINKPVHKREEHAWSVVDKLQIMILKQAPPQYEHYLAALDKLNALRHPEIGRLVWQMMEREKVIPNYELTSTMLRMCAETGNGDWALEVWNRYCTEAPWLDHASPDPAPMPDQLYRTLQSLTISELKELPMWAKVHHTHPNVKRAETDRWNVTRDVYLSMVRCMCTAGHAEIAETLLRVLEEKMQTTPTPKVRPPPLTPFDKSDMPQQVRLVCTEEGLVASRIVVQVGWHSRWSGGVVACDMALRVASALRLWAIVCCCCRLCTVVRRFSSDPISCPSGDYCRAMGEWGTDDALQGTQRLKTKKKHTPSDCSGSGTSSCSSL